MNATATATATTTAKRPLPVPRLHWLRLPYLRRSNLKELETAIRAGRVRADDPELGVLTELATDPTLKGRETMRVARIVAEIERQSLARQQAELRAEQQEHAS
jgi:hypothetical protein